MARPFLTSLQPPASHSLRSHACRLRGIFSENAVSGKNDFHFFCGVRAAKLCEAFEALRRSPNGGSAAAAYI